MMYTREDLIKDIKNIGIKHTDTLLVHSSMKALGEVDGGGETVIDAFIEYMKDGLLIFPTHSWETVNKENTLFDPLTEPSCIGILSNLFLKRPGVIRSWHPTHSVAALGKEAEEYTAGEEKTNTACPRSGCWGRLYERKAKILFLGCSTSKNTYIHGVEEWNNIANRLDDTLQEYKIRKPDGKIIICSQHRHHSPIKDISVNYDKIQIPMLHRGIAVKGKIGDAESYLCDAKAMADLTSEFLKKDPDLFLHNKPVPFPWFG
ncbi:MAG: AAC(3) family N-acetyltransferase [Spirochaetaceae bacterium]|nr:AAC(3) family N-acetyltransferase [Spirochaetaceae bacterium]